MLALALVAVCGVKAPARAQEAAPPQATEVPSSPVPTPATTPPATEVAPSAASQTAPTQAPPAVAQQPTDPAAQLPDAGPATPTSPLEPLATDAAPAAAPAAAPIPTDAAAPPAGEPSAAAPETGPTAAANLPRDLSPWNMFMHADLVVKAVMIGLAFASVVTWTVWLAKTLELAWAKRRLASAFKEIHASGTLAEAAQRLGGRKGVVTGLIEMAALELRLSVDTPDKAGIKERVGSRLDGLTLAAGRDMNRGTGVLATIGSTSPFVGLFGTVWGIMNSFIGISEAQTTNLAIVAPGIAEALLATAIGLVAAIPAVIVYNHFARQISGYKATLAEASAEVMRLVSRDLDRGFRVMPARAAE